MAQAEDLRTCELVFLDIATTGFHQYDKTIQITARTKDTYKFNVYIYPHNKDIKHNASKMNGFTIKDRYLYRGGDRLYTVEWSEAVYQFLQYLESFRENVILVSHNGNQFDFPKILKCIRWLRLIKRFKRKVKGFVDSIAVFKNHFSKKNIELKSYSLPILAKTFLKSTCNFDIYDADLAIEMLMGVLQSQNIDENFIKAHVQRTNVILSKIYTH